MDCIYPNWRWPACSATAPYLGVEQLMLGAGLPNRIALTTTAAANSCRPCTVAPACPLRLPLSSIQLVPACLSALSLTRLSVLFFPHHCHGLPAITSK